MTGTLSARLQNLRKIYSDAIAFPDLRRERRWHSAIDGAWPDIADKIDRLTREVECGDALAEAAQAIEPYLDAIICYASTTGEHEPNRLAKNFRAALTTYQNKEGDS